MTYYDILGVPQTASSDEIKAAYRVQIKFFHPDVFRGNPEVARIKALQLNEAYDVLRSPDKRKEYDLYLLNTQRRRTETPPPPPPPPRAGHQKAASNNRSGQKISTPNIVTLAVIVLFACVFFIAANQDRALSEAPSTSVSEPDLAPVSPPANGKVFYSSPSYGERIAPFTVKTTGSGYYFIKLRDRSSGTPVLIFFIHGGQTVDLDVPLGDFELSYAHGDTWYGESALFGEDTTYCKADDTFLFYEDEGYVNGWTVELYLQRNGNLSMDNIPADEF